MRVLCVAGPRRFRRLQHSIKDASRTSRSSSAAATCRSIIRFSSRAPETSRSLRVRNHNLSPGSGIRPPATAGAGRGAEGVPGAADGGGNAHRRPGGDRQGLIVAGLGGSMCYNRGRTSSRTSGCSLYMLRLVPVLVWHRIRTAGTWTCSSTHAPRAGIHDGRDVCHRGFKPFVVVHERLQAALPRARTRCTSTATTRSARAEYRHTLVVNAFDHCVIEYRGKK